MVRLFGRTQKGFSIVELMVAILIGLIILAGVIQVVVTSKSTFLGQEEMSFIQENARYAMDVIGKDIQGAGYWGCAGSGAKAAMVARVAAVDSAFMSRLPVSGFEGSGTAPVAYAGDIRVADDADGDDIQPDSILVRGLRGQTYPVQSHVVGTLALSTETSLGAGSFVGVVAEDCKRIGVFKASGVSADKEAITYSSTDNYVLSIKPSLDDEIICNPADGNCGANAGYVQMYGPSSTVMAYEAVAYYVGDSSILGAAPSVPVLKRAVLRGNTVVEEEIALGAENMQILYGEIRGGNTMQYVAADAVTDWNNVAAVQVSILFRSLSASQPSVEDKDLLGNTYKDRFARQVVTSTYRLRNRI